MGVSSVVRVPEQLGEDFDVAELFLKVLAQQIAGHKSGESCVHVPRAESVENVSAEDSSRWNHFHMVPELFFQIGGCSEFSFPHQQQSVRAGECIIIPRHLPHEERMEDGKQPFANIVVVAYSERLTFHLTIRDPASGIIRSLNMECIRGARSRVLMSCMDEIIRASHVQETFSQDVIDGLYLGMLASMHDLVENRDTKMGISNSKVDQCLEYIDYNFGNSELSVTVLAEWLQCHPDYLSKLFHQERGEKLNAHINARRIHMAKEALQATALPVSQIAQASGFQDPAYFSRLFKKKHACTPIQFRQSLNRT